MNTKVNISIGLAVIVVIFGVGYLKQTKVEVNVEVPTTEQQETLGAIPGNTVQDFFCINGGCTAIREGKYQDATSTIFSVLNPFGATSTARAVLITSTGATTSMTYQVGTSTLSSVVAATAGWGLINTDKVATSTAATIISGETGNLGTGQVSAGSGTSREIQVGPSERITGFVDNPFFTDEGGVTGSNNIFDGRFRIEFRR